MTSPEAERILARLRAEADPRRAVGEKKYLKSDLVHLGVRVGLIRKAAKDSLKAVPDLGPAGLRALSLELWTLGIHEARVAAVELLNAGSRHLAPGDAAFLEKLLRESKTWALVDALSTGALADLHENHASFGVVLDCWSSDPDFWLRRASLLALLPSLRRGEGDFGRFSAYADRMLEEKEFFIRKAIGWILRDTSRKRPELVASWLGGRLERSSGVTRREAVKYLDAGTREKYGIK